MRRRNRKTIQSFNLVPPSVLPCTEDVKAIIDLDCIVVSETGKINAVDMDCSMDQRESNDVDCFILNDKDHSKDNLSYDDYLYKKSDNDTGSWENVKLEVAGLLLVAVKVARRMILLV